MITRCEAIKLLAQHGFEPWENTVYCQVSDGTFHTEPNSSFDVEMGKQKRYNLKAVMQWLGY